MDVAAIIDLFWFCLPSTPSVIPAAIGGVALGLSVLLVDDYIFMHHLEGKWQDSKNDVKLQS